MSSHPQPTQSVPPSSQLLQLASGYWISRALGVIIRLNIADLLKDGPKSADDLAATTQTNPKALYRILRMLASVGLSPSPRSSSSL
jgi:hypothetical protein